MPYSNKEQKREYNKKWHQLNKEKNKEKKAEYNKKWYQLNKEKKAEYNERNKEKIAEYDKKYKEKNKEKKAEYDKKYYKLNNEKISKYRELNKENRAEYDKKYRELNKKKISEYNKAQRYEKRAICLEYLGGKCVKCGTTHNLQFDHIKREGKKYSITRRITGNFDNLKEELDKCQLLCVDCHLKKTAKEWAILRGDA